MKYDFIEIGTSDFRTIMQTANDDVFGLSIEPIQLYLDALPDKRNVTKVNYAISDKNSTIDIFYVSPDNIKKYNLPEWVRGCNSINSPHPSVVNLLKDTHDQVITIQQVKSVTWESLINEFSIESVNFLKIDTEGHDHVILNEYYNECIKNQSLLADKIIFEMNSLSNQPALDDLILKFKNIGYLGIRHQDDYELTRNKPYKWVVKD